MILSSPIVTNILFFPLRAAETSSTMSLAVRLSGSGRIKTYRVRIVSGFNDYRNFPASQCHRAASSGGKTGGADCQESVRELLLAALYIRICRVSPQQLQMFCQVL